MLKGDNYRPLIISGKSTDYGSCIGKVIVNKNAENKVDTIQVLGSRNVSYFEEGYSGYLFEEINIPVNIIDYLNKEKHPFLIGISKINTLVDADVIEINSSAGILKVLYRANSDDNALVVTNNCNCNCIMCPDSFSLRQKLNNNSIDNIIKLIDLIETNPKYLCITGGEPTLLKYNLFTLLEHCKAKLNNTQFMLLTNARMFCYKDYAREFRLHKPSKLVAGIPLYGHSSNIHDFITDTDGSFKQTFRGTANLLEMGVKVEIRVVVNKLNYLYLHELSNFIIRYFPNVLRVNFMALEMLGNAVVNKDKVWIDYSEIKDYVRNSVINLVKNGIETYLYNFPLCYVDESIWSIAIRSISDYKVMYFNECSECRVKSKCGGFFNSTINLSGLHVNPVT